MKLGKEAMEALRAEITGRLLPGDELVVVGAVALKGTAVIAERKYSYLRQYFSEGFMQDSIRIRENFGVGGIPQQSRAWQMAVKAGASALYAMGEGGVLSALWKMAEASQVGLEADLRKIPIRQESIEICERFDLNPYKLLSDGAILLGIRGGEALAGEYRRMGLPAAVIGQTNSGNDRLLYSGENARYLERPSADEIGRIKQEEVWRD
ncbi:MAG: AIR synthase-related protein [Eubacteriales bacterium]|nr:AIR synthase-related protein [Eubacteriales bacterium]